MEHAGPPAGPAGAARLRADGGVYVTSGDSGRVGHDYGARLAEAIREGREAQPDFDLAVKRHRLLDAFQRSSDRGRACRYRKGAATQLQHLSTGECGRT